LAERTFEKKALKKWETHLKEEKKNKIKIDQIHGEATRTGAMSRVKAIVRTAVRNSRSSNTKNARNTPC